MTKQADSKRPAGDERDRALARLERALKEALGRGESAESKLQDQRQRLESLGAGREESMRALAEAREELRRVVKERDELRQKLERIDSVQSATIALPDEEPEPARVELPVPSLEDLMSALGEIESSGDNPVAGHLHQRVQSARDGDKAEVMLSPELVFPEQYAATAESAEQAGPASKLLVLLDADRPVKYPLYKETMTIGRADAADIQIDNDFLSRVHARIVSTPTGVAIEDVESKNGIRVNAKDVKRKELRHGDIIDVGRLRFRFIDIARDDAD
jgi:hypothetical protein